MRQVPKSRGGRPTPGHTETMKLKTSHNAARERINEIIVSGNILLDKVTGEFHSAKDAGTFREEQHLPQWKDEYIDWLHRCLASLQDTFPTPMEAIKVKNAPAGAPVKGTANVKWAALTNEIKAKLSALDAIIKSVDEYTIEMTEEVFIEDIDSFARARDINPRQVKRLLPLDLAGDQVRAFFADILGDPLEKHDQGDAATDIFTTRVKLGGDRVATAVLLKGATTKGKLSFKKCGKDGEHLARLLAVPAHLYVIQHVDQIESRVVRELKDKIAAMKGEGKGGRMCVVDGVDTARIFVAYGKIAPEQPDQVPPAPPSASPASPGC